MFPSTVSLFENFAIVPGDNPEAAAYIGVSVGALYQYVHNKKISCYKPIGERGNAYFKKSELDEFMLQNKKLADYEVARKAAAILNGEDL
ncbi:MAG: helix-turn-helix domain-containing protein [Treponema sp.]|nr:helix-turn-helix domain-containing protein [Treponema sp.]